MRLTAKEIASYRPPEGKDHIVFADDFPGLGLRYRNGKANWIFQWSSGSGTARRTGRIKLGGFPQLSPQKAREIAEEHHARVTLGFDPSQEKRRRLAETEHVFGILVADHLRAIKDTITPTYHVEVKRYLERYAAKLHKLPLANVDRRTVAKLLDEIAERRGKITMNRCRSALSALFVWAMKKGRVESNPTVGTEIHEEHARDRFLTDDELRSVWNALDADDYGDIVRLLVLTGQRRGEIADLKWSEIDFERNVIALPPERTKNGLRHEVPMSTAVRSIFSARANTSDRVFGTGVQWHRRHQALIKKSGVVGWTLHDLRRTASTGMGELQVQPHIIECVLNHVGGFRAGVGGTYNRSPYAREKKQALDLWADHVVSVVENHESNVTSFRGSVQ
jgi:integrase